MDQHQNQWTSGNTLGHEHSLLPTPGNTPGNPQYPVPHFHHHQAIGASLIYPQHVHGGMNGPSPMDFYLPPLPGYVPPVTLYPPHNMLTPGTTQASPPDPPTPPPPHLSPPRSPLVDLTARGASEEADIGGEVNLRNFLFSFQVWLRIDAQAKDRKKQWENMKGRNLHLPAHCTLAHLDLRQFKKMLASVCKHNNQPCTNRILHCDRNGELTWLFHVNGSTLFRRVDNIEVTTDEHFREWILSTALAGRQTFGVRILMEHPQKVQEINQMSSKVRSSLKRANREYVPSSEGVGQDHEEAAEDAQDDSDSDQTLDEDPQQALTTRITDIRAQLTAGGINVGEVPLWTDPRDPRHVIRMTPELFRIWAQDLLDKVPGVSLICPPLNRREFKTCKRSAAVVARSGSEAGDHGPPPKQSKSVLAGLSEHETEALALEVDTPLEEFLHFAKLRDPDLVASIMGQLQGLGIDSWFIFKSEDCAAELRAVGMLYGTVKKLTMAARAYETVLANRAINSVASGSGSH